MNAVAGSFLADILAHSHDDTPRLVYADWLTDNATSEAERARAEFIRLQCSFPSRVYQGWSLPLVGEDRQLLPVYRFYDRVRRAERLLERHGWEWIGQMPDLPGSDPHSTEPDKPWSISFVIGSGPRSPACRHDVSWRWSRGWPSHLRLSPATWLALGDHFLKTWPVTEVELTEPIQVRVDMRPGSANRFLSFVGDPQKRCLEVEERTWHEIAWESGRNGHLVDTHTANCWPSVRFTVVQQPATGEG